MFLKLSVQIKINYFQDDTKEVQNLILIILKKYI